MKKKLTIVLLLLLGIFTITGCGNVVNENKNNNNNNNITEKNNILKNKVISLSFNETKKIKNDLSITLQSIEDSRCPENVECVWSGELEYTLIINNDYKTISTVNNKKIKYKNYIITIIVEECNENKLTFNIEEK